jgi:hypothetical protein
MLYIRPVFSNNDDNSKTRRLNKMQSGLLSDVRARLMDF